MFLKMINNMHTNKYKYTHTCFEERGLARARDKKYETFVYEKVSYHTSLRTNLYIYIYMHISYVFFLGNFCYHDVQKLSTHLVK